MARVLALSDAHLLEEFRLGSLTVLRLQEEASTVFTLGFDSYDWIINACKAADIVESVTFDHSRFLLVLLLEFVPITCYSLC